MSSPPRRRHPDGDDPPPDSAAVEREWVARIRAGDQAAFEAMFRAYYDRLCRSVARYLGSRDAAEDVVQALFARIWRDRAGWAVTNLSHYLHSAARRRATSEFRHAAVERRAAPHLALEGSTRAEATTTDAAFEAEELARRIRQAIAALPPRTREAFVLSRSEGLPYGEVAVRMKISPKTVGVHISNAMAFLRRILGLPTK